MKALLFILMLLVTSGALACDNPRNVSSASSPTRGIPDPTDYATALGYAVIDAYPGAVNGGEYCVRYTDRIVEVVILTRNLSEVSGRAKPGTRIPAPPSRAGGLASCGGSSNAGPTQSFTYYVNTIWVGDVTGTIYDITSYPVTIELGGGGGGCA